MPSALLPLCIFASIDYYLLWLHHQNNIVLEYHESFPKQTFRNRVNTLGSNGVTSLTIPVAHKQSKIVNDIEINYDTDWPRLLTQMLVSNYRKSSYFEFYEQDILEILNRKYSSFSELATATTLFVLEQIGLSPSFEKTTSFDPNSQHTDYRNRFKPSKNQQLFEQPNYYQVFSDRFDFIPNLCVLDLLFNLGPESGAYLHSCMPLEEI